MKAYLVCVILPFLAMYLPALLAWVRMEGKNDV